MPALAPLSLVASGGQFVANLGATSHHVIAMFCCSEHRPAPHLLFAFSISGKNRVSFGSLSPFYSATCSENLLGPSLSTIAFYHHRLFHVHF